MAVSKETRERIDALTKVKRGWEGYKDRSARFLSLEEEILDAYKNHIVAPAESRERDLKRNKVFIFHEDTPGSCFELVYEPPRRGKWR